MKIAIGSDHAGFELKEHIKGILPPREYEVTDVGTHSPDSVDYPDLGFEVARRVAAGEADRGILICGTGIGMSIAANKVRGIRAALVHDLYTAAQSRRHNDANVLVLAGRVTGKGLAEEIVKTWLSTEFEGGRHLGRLRKIETFEEDTDR
jgi:ribose 5-phosphate isomerase B